MNEHEIECLQKAYRLLGFAIQPLYDIGRDPDAGPFEDGKRPIQDIDAELYEAACLDLHRARRAFWRILERKNAVPSLSDWVNKEPADLWE